MIEELIWLYPPHSHLRRNNGPEFIANALHEGALEMVAALLTSHWDQPGKTYTWNRETAGSWMNF